MAAATGVWAVRSDSPTVYYVDCDRHQVMRARAHGSPRFVFDDIWVPLVELVSRSADLKPVGSGCIRVGERPEYLTDPRGYTGDYEWRIQRVVTSLERLGEAEAAELRARGAGAS